MYRLAALAARLKHPAAKIQSDLLVRGSGRLFLKDKDAFYAFQRAKDIIIPEDIARNLGKLKYGTEISQIELIKDSPVLTVEGSVDSKKRLVMTLLGHFNHGKTSILDGLINDLSKNSGNTGSKPLLPSNIVADEKYGITQVYLHFLPPL